MGVRTGLLTVNAAFDFEHIAYVMFNLTILFQDVIENSDWNKCLDINGMSLARCIYNCEDNGDCETDCVTQFKGRTVNCPCEVGKITHFTI